MVESTSAGSGPFAAATIHTFLYDEPSGGSLEAGAVDLAATFADRQIRIRFANG